MFCIVFGILQAGSNNTLFAIFLVLGAAFMLAFFLYIRSRERAGKEALLSTGLFKNRTCNLALVTQNIQWLVLLGTSFVVSVYLQEVRGYSAIKTGVVFTAATLGILASSLAAERLAKRFPQKTLIVAGFVVTLIGIVLLLGLVRALRQHLGVRARAVAHRPRRGRDAHPLRERRPVELPRGAARRDLGAVAEHLQPRLVVRYGDRRHHPRLGRRQRDQRVRLGDGNARRLRAHRACGGPPPSCQTRAADRLTGSAAQRATVPVSVITVKVWFSRSAPSPLRPLYAFVPDLIVQRDVPKFVSILTANVIVPLLLEVT